MYALSENVGISDKTNLLISAAVVVVVTVVVVLYVVVSELVTFSVFSVGAVVILVSEYVVVAKLSFCLD